MRMSVTAESPSEQPKKNRASFLLDIYQIKGSGGTKLIAVHFLPRSDFGLPDLFSASDVLSALSQILLNAKVLR